MKIIEILENRKQALRVSEVAKILGIIHSKSTKWSRTDRFGIFTRGAIRFCPSELAEWIKKEILESTQRRNSNNDRNPTEPRHSKAAQFLGWPFRGFSASSVTI